MFNKSKKNPNPKEFRKIWIDALRSGKYKQGKGQLKQKGFMGLYCKYCCLGVACDLYQKHFINNMSESLFRMGKKINFEYAGHYTRLPDTVKKALGLRTQIGEYQLAKDHKTSLIINNDHNRKSFKEIANIIESEPEGLFSEP